VKKLFAILIMALLFTPSAFATDDTVRQTTAMSTQDTRIIDFKWVGDSSAGTVTSTQLDQNLYNSIDGWYLVAVMTDPGATAPTDDYDLVINNSSGLDMMDGNLTDRDTADTEIAYADTLASVVDSRFTVVWSNQTDAGATGTIRMYFSMRPAPGVVTIAAAAGGSTEAKQDAANALLTTIDADTSVLFGTVAGSEQQVDIVAALPAGTNAIGKLAANSGVDIGDVTVDNLVTDVAVDAAQTNNPVYTGGIFETTPTVIETGDAGALHLDANQATLVANAYDPCLNSPKITLPINQAATAELIAQVAGQKIYICGGMLATDADETAQFAEGTGTTCGTSRGLLTGVISLPADGNGFLINDLQTNTANEDLCLLQGGTANVDGWITYVQK